MFCTKTKIHRRKRICKTLVKKKKDSLMIADWIVHSYSQANNCESGSHRIEHEQHVCERRRDVRLLPQARDRPGLYFGRRNVEGEFTRVAQPIEFDHAGEFGIRCGMVDQFGHVSFCLASSGAFGPNPLEFRPCAS